MVPIRDDNPSQTTAYVTYLLILINVLVFLYELTLNGASRAGESSMLSAFFSQWALVPGELTASLGGSPEFSLVGEAVTLITSQFLHGGFLHLGGNMLYLWIFGNNVEDRMGHSRFLFFYLLCGVLAGLAQYFFSVNSAIPALGASGAVAGVLGAYIRWFPRARILTFVPIFIILIPFRIPALWFLGIWFVQQALYGVASLGAPMNVGMESGGIAYWAHAGGFVAGAVLAPLFSKTRN